jgi:hypothetical protein
MRFVGGRYYSEPEQSVGSTPGEWRRARKG